MHDGNGTPGDRRVEHEFTGLGKFRGNGFADLWCDRAHIYEDAALRETCKNALLAKRYTPHRFAVGDDAEYDFRSFGQCARAVGPFHSALEERGGLIPAPVPAGDRVAAGNQPRDDQGAHGAKADKSDLHAEILFRDRALLIFPLDG